MPQRGLLRQFVHISLGQDEDAAGGTRSHSGRAREPSKPSPTIFPAFTMPRERGCSSSEDRDETSASLS